MIQIIPNVAYISIGSVKYPLNSIIYQSFNNLIRIFNLNGSLLFESEFENFLDKDNKPYTSVEQLLTDLESSHA